MNPGPPTPELLLAGKFLLCALLVALGLAISEYNDRHFHRNRRGRWW